MRLIAGLAALSLLAACGGSDSDSGAINAEESQKLNEAAEMLDASPDSLVAENNHLGNGELPAEEGAAANMATADNGASGN